MGLEGLLAGHHLCERYRVEKVIGRGGMGAVYLARDVRLERAVAVKVITTGTADVAARGRLRARFHREARAAARLQHPNVVTVYDFGTDPRLDLDFLVMELLRGEDVASRLARSEPLEVGAGVEIVEQAARGLAAGHRVGLIHRDVKPGNLFLVDGHGGIRVCVLDFGIVQLLAEDEEATMTHLTVVGRAPHSPAYASPEQLRGETRLTPASDVWGLGVTAFQVLTGERPFGELEHRRMLDGMAVVAPSARVRNLAIPEAVDDVIRIALAHRPADRFRDAADFARALAAARLGAPPPVRAARPPLVPSGAAAGPDEDHTLLEPTSAVPRSAERWGFARRRPGAPAPDEGTLLDPGPGGTRALESAGGGRTIAAPEPLAPAPRAANGRRWLHRAGTAAWRLVVTAVAFAVAAAFTAGMYRAYDDNLAEPFYASVVGLTLAIPWAVHRLFGRRGSYLLSLLGCIAVAIATFRLLAPLSGPDNAVLALPVAQLLASAWVARLTRREEEREPADLASISF